MRKFTRLLLCTVLAMAMIPLDALKAQETGPGSDERPRLGSPDAVDNQIDFDALTRDALFERRLPEGWFDWKDRLQEEKGISLGFDYTGLYFDASDAPDEGSASSGDFRLYGSWQLADRGTDNSGSLVWKVEHRHKYGNIPPSELQFNLGGIGLIGPPFSDQGFRWTNLYWQQRWNDGEYVLLAGFLDVTDYLDAFGLGSPWLHFSNFAFSTGTTTIALPDDATLGVAGGAWLNDNIYLLASLTNANADPENPFNEVDSFFNEREYFTSVEVGYTTSRDRAYFDNTHITLWHNAKTRLLQTGGA